MSDTPKISRNSGISADDGVERKKSIRNSTLRYARSLLPSTHAERHADRGGDQERLQRALHRDREVGEQRPAGEPGDERVSVSNGVGSRIGLMKPKRTSEVPDDEQQQRPHDRQQASPRGTSAAARWRCRRGRRPRAAAGSGCGIGHGLPLVEHRLDHRRCLLEDALVGEQVEELLEVGDVDSA